jgi:hypothetical protein
MSNRLKLFAMSAVALAGLAASAAAQDDGYRFGVGIDYARGGGACRHFGLERNFFGLPIAPTPRIDAPPFFALYPPVYYSQDIVARPYGVSPYAAPPGIEPVEFSRPSPVRQTNPYYVDPNAVPVPNPAPATPESTDNKATMIQSTTNPFYDASAAPSEQLASNR